MPESKRVVLCGTDQHLRDVVTARVRESGAEPVLVPDARTALGVLRQHARSSALLIVEVGSDVTAALELVRAVPRPEGASRLPVAAFLDSTADPAQTARLKRHGMLWCFTADTPEHELLHALKTIVHASRRDRRSHPRAPAAVPVQFRMDDEPPRRGVVRDLSEGGIFVETEERCVLGAELEVAFALPGAGPPIRAAVEVVFVSPKMERKSALLPGIGCKFRRLAQADLERIQTYVREALNRMPDIHGSSMIGLTGGPR